MLYIFHVDMGRMMTFEMNLALESVQYLKETIERYHGIPSNSQVLLVSGGETLQINSRVCSYSAGTDTNPIYMFSTIIDTKNPPPPWPSIEPDSDLEEQVERCLSLPATYNTVVTRTQLAQQIYEMAKDEHKICEKLVHDQHLQQQGWAAVVANMEDITEEFKERCEDFYRGFKEHLEQRQKYVEFLQFFNSDLDKLSNIPILPGLVQNAEEKPFHAFDEIYADTESFSRANSVTSTTGAASASAGAAMATESSTVPNNDLTAHIQNLEISNEKEIAMTLLHWISASENQKSLRSMAENCLRELNKIDEKVMNSLQIDIQKAIDAAQQENMKEIKGLEDRLCGLDKLIYDAKQVVQEQSELAQGFQQNQTRANNLRDPSILPDLCASHCSQIKVMLKKHKHLRGIRRRISKAKEELGTNLHHRLKFVIYIENRMCETDSKLLFYHRCLRRLQKHLSIVEQIHQAPFMYVTAVTEVVRRRLFSSAFFKWASELACHLLKIYNDEVLRREDFSARFEGHFLSTLFPGMDDMPPPFATEAPSIFDSSLPNLTKSDIQVLSNHLPEITSKIQLPDLGDVIEFFASRSGSSTKSQDKSGLSDNQVVNIDQIIDKPLDIHVHLKDYERGFESETDTEEFEKVGQSPIERRHNSNNNSQIPSQTSINNNNNDNDNLLQQIVPEIIKPEMSSISTSTIAVTTQNTETLTEENLGTTRIEVERLKDLLKKMYQLSHDSLSFVKHQLQNVKTQSLCDKQTIDLEFGKLNDMWERIQMETEQRERITIQKLTVDHELELSDVKKSLLLKDEEIEALSNDKKELKGFHVCELVQRDKDKDLLIKTMDEFKSTITGLETRLLCAANEQEKAVQEMKEKLIQEHKTEIESLRCRFKLMTISMERSPSDTSLEKIERPDMIDLTNHESILLQTRENLEREHEIAIKSAVDRERARWETRTEQLRGQTIIGSSPRSPTTSQDLFKRILDEKERQMDVLTERESVLLRENQKYRETIQQLAESDDKQESNWKDKYEALLKENKTLNQELNAEKHHQSGNSNLMPQREIGTITDKLKSPTCTSCASTVSSQKSQISVYVNSCSTDDTVLVVWNSFHSRYMILQENPLLYFLHADSYPLLNIETPSADGTPPKVNYFLGKVVKKEYCHAKKGNNRYKVPKGTKFYQVVVRSKSNKSLSDLRSGHTHLKDKEGSSASNPEVTSPTSKVIPNEKIQQHQQQIQLIDSFAQTEFTKFIMDGSVGVGGNVPDGTSYDMVDSGVDEAHSKNENKPRNTSFSEEDDLGDHISYTDDDDLIATKATEISSSMSAGQRNLEESSVTTAASTEDVDDASTTTLLNNQINLPTIMTTTAEVTADITTASTETTEVVSTTIIEKLNDDDSDEYRSLEAKDDDEHFSMINN